MGYKVIETAAMDPRKFVGLANMTSEESRTMVEKYGWVKLYSVDCKGYRSSDGEEIFKDIPDEKCFIHVVAYYVNDDFRFKTDFDESNTSANQSSFL